MEFLCKRLFNLFKNISNHFLKFLRYARMIHNTDGTRNEILYDRRNHQAIYSVGRKYLNEILLTGE